MKINKILAGVCFVILLFVAVNLFPKSDKFYYEFEKYKETIDSPIAGTVTRLVEGKNFFGAQFGTDPNNYYRFTYHVERTPKQWLNNYPKDFIIIGDSIVKKTNNDTFFVIRNTTVWTYLLPNKSFDK